LTWLGYFPEIEGFMCTIEDKVVNNKNYRTFIVKDGTVDDSCRQCSSAVENVQRIISGCQT
jgi:hypothetical protein